jgi:diguanylate cyclase (GGDEF)-like protein/PAS domain S-box-containing protein
MTVPLRVLMVEDSLEDTLLLAHELRQGGYDPFYERVDTARDMEMALGRSDWDIILADHAMPQFDAWGALEVLQKSRREIPLLLVSGSIDAEEAVRLLRAGVQDYIHKQDLRRLVPAVRREMSQAENNRRHRQTVEELRLLGTAVATAANAIFITNQRGEIRWANGAFCRLSGYNSSELLGKTPGILKSGAQPAAFYAELWQTILAGKTWTGEVVERRKDGTSYIVQQTITPLCGQDGVISHFVAVHEDITRRKEAEARVEYLAYHDELTGLPNRTLLQDRLAQAILQARRNSRLVALLFLDLDQFKEINDTLGHKIGDQFLKETALRLQGCVRATDSLARLGGDEFVIVQTELASVDGALRLARKVLDALSGPYTLGGREIRSTASIGITVYPLDDPEGSRLLENADMAMYRAKAEGRNRFAFYTPALHSAIQARCDIEAGLGRAIANQELLLYYQPQIDLNTNSIVGMEALLRWDHPTRGLLLPAAFLQTAEDSGLILAISDYVVRQGCAQSIAWQAQTTIRPRTAINISASHLRNEALVRTVTDALNDTGLKAKYLELELTETALMQDETTAARVMGELNRLGIVFSIDDFGTGHSSLKYLKQLPVHKLKIDQSFVRNLPHDPDDAVIVRATIALGHQLGLRVIAEGVETEDQVTFLKNHGCDEGQGFYFYQPLTPQAMTELLQRGNTPQPRRAETVMAV